MVKKLKIINILLLLVLAVLFLENRIFHGCNSGITKNENKLGFEKYEWNRQEIYCPKCGAKLNRKKSADIYGEEFSCSHGHWFYMPMREYFSYETCKASALSVPGNIKGNKELIKYWLSNDEPRSKLNSQLVEILLRVLNYYETGKHVPSDSEEQFKYCPVCGKSLKPFDSGDGYTFGLICPETHKYYERGGKIIFEDEGKRVQLTTEMQDGVLVDLLKVWSNPNSKDLDSEIHQSLKNMFAGLLKTYIPQKRSIQN